MIKKSNNFLILGSGSSITEKYLSLIGSLGNDFYGVSTSTNVSAESLLKKSICYSSIDEYSSIRFSNVLIIASRNPLEGGTLQDFTKVNDLIERTLESIKFPDHKKPKITLLSSFSVYGKQIDSISDDTPTEPSDFYGESKILLEQKIQKLSENFNADALVCRLPVFLYPGVSAKSGNFMAKLSLAIKQKSDFTMMNPKDGLGAIFDVENLAKLHDSDISGFKILNCGANADINFEQIGSLALKLGLNNVNWSENNRPSVKVCLNSLTHLIGGTPSAKDMVYKWLPSEVIL